LVARFWQKPYEARCVRWGTELHDRFALPHFVKTDLEDVIDELAEHGTPFDATWFRPHFEFRFPLLGSLEARGGLVLQVREALEPWHVLGEQAAAGGTARYVDSSVERVEVKVLGMVDERHVVACNGRRVPLHPTGTHGEYVAGVRYRAWQPPSALHPTIPVHAPLVFDVLDRWSGRAVAGCTHHVVHPGGRSYDRFPRTSFEAEGRRAARFFRFGHSPGPRSIPEPEPSPLHPFTLDLRRGGGT
ncbi:MAG: transglutaminase family protein, partial [Polyangiaceae bacterium]